MRLLRTLASAVLILAGATLIALWAVGGVVVRAVEDGSAVHGIAATALDDPLIRAAMAEETTAQAVEALADAGLDLEVLGHADRQLLASVAEAFADLGVELIALPAAPNGYPDPKEMIEELGARGLTRILVEGGATLAAVLLRAALIDRIAWFRNDGIIGGDGIPAVEAYGIDRLATMARFQRHGIRKVGADVLETFSRRY